MAVRARPQHHCVLLCPLVPSTVLYEYVHFARVDVQTGAGPQYLHVHYVSIVQHGSH